MTFDEIIAGSTIPDGWQQGRGAYGGLVLGMMTRAAMRVVEAARPLRAISGELVGPVAVGAASVKTEILRAGTGVTTVDVRLEQEGAVQAHAVLAFGKARATYTAAPALAPPPWPAWRGVPVTPLPVPPGPTFTARVEYRAVELGPGETGGWVRFRDPGPARDAAYVVALADCWWPAFIEFAGPPRVGATLVYTAELLAGLDGLDPDAPLAYRGRILAGGDGYAVEQRELWGEDGRLVALNQQTLVIMA